MSSSEATSLVSEAGDASVTMTPSPSIPRLISDLPTSTHTPTNNQAFADAIASLSHAADLLSNASKTLSSAVESLVLASSQPGCLDFLTHASQILSPKEDAHDWLSRDYSLNNTKLTASEPTSTSLLFETGPGSTAQGNSISSENNKGNHSNQTQSNDQGHAGVPLDAQSEVSRFELEQSRAITSGKGHKETTPGVADSRSEQHSTSALSTNSSPRSSGGHISTEIESVFEGTIGKEIESPGQNREQNDSPYRPTSRSSTERAFGQPSVTVETTGFALAGTPDESQSSSSSTEAGYVAPATRTYAKRPSYSTQQYIILDEELDVIPLIAYLAEFKPRQNTLCFVKDVKIYRALESMIEELVSIPVYMLIPGGTTGTKNAAGRACDAGDGCLIFCSSYSTPLPQAIRDKDFHAVLHVGWTGNYRLYDEQLDQYELQRATLILTQKEFDEHELSEDELCGYGYKESPSTEKLNDLTLRHKFSRMRDSWVEVLSDSSNYGNLCRCFEAWISFHYTGPHQRNDWSAIDVANEANKFAKSALLHGNNKVPPRDPVHPTVGRRLSVTSRFVSIYGLEEAVGAKKLVVEEFDE
ncbi:bifunctional glutamate/proline--tRNA ligase [Ceratobasidium sp. AG-Ba]|nr:bifunctional glutamate/proline--tRNA ligase [Ceratobasidium sp. AG-Ba]